MNNTPIIREVTPENLQKEHICCALGTTSSARQCSASKKEWMEQCFPQGYRFYKLDVQGKVFIETVPATAAWSPIQAEGWLFIDCLWVSGQYAGKGYGASLLATAIAQAKEQGFQGLVALSADKKRPFLSDPAFYARHGFVQAHTAPPYYQLMALPLQAGAASTLPRFAPSVLHPQVPAQGIAIYYSHHCPHTSKYVPLLQKTAQSMGVAFQSTQFTSLQQAQQGPNPFTTYSMYYNGEFVTNEIFSESKLRKFIENN